MKRSFASRWLLVAHESWKAAELARNVKGVKAVRNDISVK